MPEFLRKTESLSQAAIRVEVARDRASEAKVALAIEAVSLLRGLRSQMGIAQREPLSIRLQAADQADQLSVAAQLLKDLAAADEVTVEVGSSPPERGWAVATGEGLTLCANLAGKVDVAAETQRLEAELAKNDKELRAPQQARQRPVRRARTEAVVTEERRRLAEFERRRDELQAAHQRLAELEGAP